MTTYFSLTGTGGWIPTPRRETTCAVLSMPEAFFIFDAGTGLSRLLQQPFRDELNAAAAAGGGRPIHLFLSHYHLDHVAGLVYLPAMLKDATLHLHPPAASITGVDPIETLGAIVRKPFNPTSLADMPVDIRVEPLDEGTHEIAGVTVTVRGQIHPDPSAAYRVADLIVFATDTAADKASADFARGARLLVHEAWIDGVEEEDPQTEHIAREAYVAHTSARQAAELAAEAGVNELILCHINPLRGEEYQNRMLASAQKIFAATRILEDGEKIELER